MGSWQHLTFSTMITRPRSTERSRLTTALSASCSPMVRCWQRFQVQRGAAKTRSTLHTEQGRFDQSYEDSQFAALRYRR